MATKLAEYIVRKLIAVSVVEEGDRELYVYGFFLLITRFFFFLVTVAFGVFLKIPCESVIFYIVFILLRSYAGGVHAKTEMACTVWTALAMGISVALIKVVEDVSMNIVPLLLVGDLCLYLFSPLDSREKPLDASEQRRYKKVCYCLLAIYNAVIIVSDLGNCLFLYYPVVCSILLEAVLLIVGKYGYYAHYAHV